MGVGLETLFHLIYEMVHWIVSWCIPQYGVVEAQERGVKITGAKVVELEPGGYWQHRQRSTVYKANVKRVVREPSDVICRTKDGYTVRVGISLAFTIINIRTWLVENEDPEAGLLLDAQRVVLKYVRRHTIEEIDTLTDKEEDDLTQFAHKELGRYFGVKIKQLGITTFAETECKDLNHSGMAFQAIASNAEEHEE